jgi:hypothetical protein
MTDLAEVVVEPPTVVEVVEAAPPEVVEVNLGIKGDKGDPGDLGPTGPVCDRGRGERAVNGFCGFRIRANRLRNFGMRRDMR